MKLPADVRATNHAWMSIVSRMGAGKDAGKTGGDPAEPLATLSMYVDGAELLRNPATPAIGLASSGEPWFVGAYHYDRNHRAGLLRMARRRADRQPTASSERIPQRVSTGRA